MHTRVLSLAIVVIVETYGISLPSIQDFILKPTGTQYGNKTTTINGTCPQCLCEVFGDNGTVNDVALNCFQNDTCQLFPSFPLSYKLQPSAGALLYFLQGIFPSPSQCCMPNIIELIDRLKNGMVSSVQLSFTLGAIGYGKARPDQAVAIGWNTGHLYWFNTKDMSYIQYQTINGHATIALHNNSIFTGIDGTSTVTVLNEQTLAGVASISYPSFKRVRKFLFMNNSQTIMVTTQDNNSVTILEMISQTQFTVRVSRMDVIVEMNALFSFVLRRESFSSRLEILTARRRSTTRSSTCRRGLEAVSDRTSTRTPLGTTSFSLL